MLALLCYIGMLNDSPSLPHWNHIGTFLLFLPHSECPASLSRTGILDEVLCYLVELCFHGGFLFTISLSIQPSVTTL